MDLFKNDYNYFKSFSKVTYRIFINLRNKYLSLVCVEKYVINKNNVIV